LWSLGQPEIVSFLEEGRYDEQGRATVVWMMDVYDGITESPLFPSISPIRFNFNLEKNLENEPKIQNPKSGNWKSRNPKSSLDFLTDTRTMTDTQN
jgi:hypothetical protein